MTWDRCRACRRPAEFVGAQAAISHTETEAILRLRDADVRHLTDDQLRALAIARWKLEEERKFKKLENYWPQQIFLAFHAAGETHRERAVLSPNQVGKSTAMCAEIAMHATGLYPKWWRGKRFHTATTGVVVGQTLLLNRDKLQALLCGWPEGELGTGFIPRDRIVETTPSGIKDGFESVTVKHINGGISRILFRACQQGRANLQSITVDWAALDEEPDESIYFEILTRTNITRGPIICVFTPLLGMSRVVSRFYGSNADPNVHLTQFTLDSCELYTEERKAQMRRDYPEHEREARAEGRPVLGSGMVFQTKWDVIKIEPFALPHHWPRIGGMDFGIEHPTAAGWAAWDRDSGIYYVYDTYRATGHGALVNAEAIKARGEWIPMAWPHDGLQRSKDTGIQLAEVYRGYGVNMLNEYATHEKTGQPGETTQSVISVEAGLTQMNEAASTGKFRVFSHLTEFRDEYEKYHRVNGQVVKIADDIISGCRYGWMMRRFAQIEIVKPFIVRPLYQANSWRT